MTHFQQVIDLANRHKLPAIFDARVFADAGALLSYGPNLDTIFRRMGALTGEVLKGAKVRDVSIEQPATFDLVVNLRTAKSFGQALPNSLLVSANDVIE